MQTNLFRLLLLLSVSSALSAQNKGSSGNGWPTYGGNAGGQRFSSASQITRANIADLHPVWTYHTHALESGKPYVSRSDFEATPILFRDSLYLSTPFDRVIALDPATGAERWTYDPELAPSLIASNYTSRGVAAWETSDANKKLPCSARIFIATLDARLIALDSATGRSCAGFGNNGQVDLHQGVTPNPRHPFWSFGNTSPPTVVGDVVVLGSAVVDNAAVDIESGVVRGFDARTGALRWSWEPLPWASQQQPRTGGGNAWSVIAADLEHGIVYVPTGAPSPDFFGGFRPGDNRDANSLVALDAGTGHKLWAFQLVHHDVWDYDIAAEPLLFNFQGKVPAVAVAAKPGMVFVLNRLTGRPLLPVEERPVPGGDIPGEKLSPTQPFSKIQMNPLTIAPGNLQGHSAAGQETCRLKLSKLLYQGIYTPPTRGGTLQFPGSLGGVNWGSMSLDPRTGTLFANVNGSAYEIRLVPQQGRIQSVMKRRKVWFTVALAVFAVTLVISFSTRRAYSAGLGFVVGTLLITASLYANREPSNSPFTFKREHNMVNSPDSFGELSNNEGAPFRIFRRVLQDEDGRPCTPLPWGAMTAFNLNTGVMEWRQPLGTLIAGEHTGSVSFGAPIVTAGDLLFTAATSQPLLRALDRKSGVEVWTGALPVPAQSTPMTYVFGGRQYIVVSAGGHGGLGTPLGDSVVAFALN